MSLYTAQNNNYNIDSDNDNDRKNRFLGSPAGPDGEGNSYASGSGNGFGGDGVGGVGVGVGVGVGAGVPSLRERAASQPPRTSEHSNSFFSSPSTAHFIPSSVGNGSPWTTYRTPLGGNGSRTGNSGGAGTGAGAGTGTGTGAAAGTPQPVPIRSSSFSAHSHSHFSSAMRGRAFPSTFEDDETELLSDSAAGTGAGVGAAELYVPPSLSRGRPTSYGPDPSRSRSQSLATVHRPPSIGSSSSMSYLRTPTMQSWNESLLSSLGSSSSPLNIQGGGGGGGGGRFGEIRPPAGNATAATRYGSLGTFGVSPSRIHASPSPSSPLTPGGGGGLPFLTANGFSSSAASSSRRYHDVSNMSPFVRDVGEILLDNNSGLGSLWAGIPRDEGNGTTSGTTSRRHSVSVVQPRRGGSNIVGFNAPGTADSPSDEQHQHQHQHQQLQQQQQQPVTRSHVFQHSPFSGAGLGGPSHYGGVGASRGSGRDSAGPSSVSLGRSLLLTDEELAGDLGLLNINPNEPPPPPSSSKMHPPSQPSSLPTYAPHSRSPVSMRDTTSPFIGLGITTPGTNGGGASSYFQSSIRQQRQQISTPTDEYPGVADSPQRSALGMHFETSQQQQQSQQLYSTDGVKGPPYINTRVSGYAAAAAASPLSPTSATSISTSPTTSRLMVNPQQPPYYPQQQRRLSDAAHGLQSGPAIGGGPTTSPTATTFPAANVNELGKGVPLHSVPSSCPLFIVEFKAGRTDLFYLVDPKLDVRVGDLVIVEADRGKDLGKVVNDGITVREVEAWQRQQAERVQAQAQAIGGGGIGPDGQPTSPVLASGGGGAGKKEINPKRIYGKAGPHETQLLAAKTQDELKALQLCQSKVRAKKLPMEVVDAEYQWDRRKLTFYFVADKRIDFRELVRELFRLYKTRIWMASLQGPGGYEQ
ncbi:hypothetical protein AX15_004204 [Amanita polypyramis BW_CC]|nr:hypothetical protein AX15_004204 [Amanita polypyramis BW_CC]